MMLLRLISDSVFSQCLTDKPSPLGLTTPLWNWILDIVTAPVPQGQQYHLQQHHTEPWHAILSVLNPLLLTLLTQDCGARTAPSTTVC